MTAFLNHRPLAILETERGTIKMSNNLESSEVIPS